MLQNPPHILVVDDDEEVRALIAEYLGQGGLQVSLAGDADEARRVLMAKSIDLAVVDLVMPGENGLSLTRFIRERLEIGVVMLTSADDPVDRIVGLAVGADDYLAKPFHPRELLMRVRAVLHRLGERASAAVAAESPAALTFGQFRLDLAARALRDPHGALLPLRPLEFALLRAFAGHAHQSLSRQRLIELMGAGHENSSERRIDIQVARVRRKVEHEPSRPLIIRTIRDRGYMFVPTVSDDAD